MFRNLFINAIYSSYDNNLVEEFYNPIFKNAVRFDRISAYFSAKTLAKYSSGIEYFARKGYKYRLIISEKISKEDYEIIRSGYKIKENIKKNMLDKLRQVLSLEEGKNISNLAYLISLGIVDIKIAFVKKGIFHDKCGIFYDEDGEVICFRGSNNETAAAIDSNYEAFTVTCSWLLDSSGFYKKIITKSISEFNKLWNNERKGIIVLKADDVIMNEILKYNKNELIVENTLLQENCVILDYVKNLVLRINMEDKAWITSSAFYKLRLKRYVKTVNSEIILFKEDLSYMDYEKIHGLIKKKAEALGIKYFLTKRLSNYIESRNIYITSRAKLGLEIKEQDNKLKDKFEKYKEVVNSNTSRQLRDKQMWDSFFMYAMSKSCNFSVPGSGKTSSVLGVYAFLKANELVKKIVMVGPKNSFGSWIDEFNICFFGKEDLRVFNIHDSKYKNSLDKKRALTYETGNVNLILLNYECLGTYKNEINEIIDDNTLLVFDEVHKIKRVEGDKPGKTASDALYISKNSKYTIAMTGTPIPNSYTDIYNVLHILYNDEYTEFFSFPVQMLKKPSEEERNSINVKIQPFFCRTTKQQLKVPEANDDKIISIAVSKEEQKLFKIITAKYRSNKLALFIRLLQLESNPKMLLNSLDLNEFQDILDMDDKIDNIDFVDYSEDVKKLVESIKFTSKMNACISQIKELVSRNKKVIVWCIFKKSIRNIECTLKKCGIKTSCIYGEVELVDRNNIINDFKSGALEVLITNPHTLAESVSLHSACHDAIYFEYSYNLVHLLQSKDRIHRLGLPDGQYTQYYYMQDIFQHRGKEFSIDKKVYNRLLEKEQVMLEAIDNNYIEVGFTSEEDLELIFGEIL